MKQILIKLKQINSIFVLGFLIFSGILKSNAQIDNNGCVIGKFGIDADLYSGAMPYGDFSPASPVGTDDWFYGVSGTGVIDTTGGYLIKTLLQGAGDPTYEKRMIDGFGSVRNGVTLYDAVYARDNFGGTGYIDPTAFPVSSKNSQPPTAWSAGPANVLGKNDLLDIGAHFRRNGTSPTSDLFLQGVIAMAEPGGAAYMDMEFFINNVTYTPGVGFSSAGTDMGHTSFQFDAAGNLIKIGDILVNISLINGGAQVDMEIRIWVKRADRLNSALIPATFNWGTAYDGATSTSEYVYASIIPKVSGNACSYVNLAGQFPTAPPWGHKGTKYNIFTTSFAEYSLAEIGLNLTKFGLDPAFLPNYDPCVFSHRSFCVKSRSSASFTASLKDFAGPYGLGNVKPTINTSGTLSCLNPNVTLFPSSIRQDATYMWTTTNGNITSNPALSSVTVNQPGTYKLTLGLTNGCTIEPSYFTVSYDPTKPFFNTTTVNTTIACIGATGSVSITPSGGSSPYTYAWNGPSSYTATTKDISNVSSGTYNVTITDKYGCTTSASGIVAAGTQIVFTPSITNVTCFGATNGSITLALTGKSPYTYSWSNGKTTQNLLNVGSGTYSVQVTDADGCRWTAGPYTITQPSGALTVTSLTKVDDSNADPAVGNGSLNLSVSGGTTAYTYAWTGPNGFTATSEDLSGLVYGQYQVTVTDAKGCTTTASKFIYEPEICNDGIDNDGNGLSDCQDGSCKPASPGAISFSADPPCPGDTVTYSVVNNASYTFTWSLPAGAQLISGQGTNAITVVWLGNQGGNVCVTSQYYGCYSKPSCRMVSPISKPSKPTSINVINN